MVDTAKLCRGAGEPIGLHGGNEDKDSFRHRLLYLILDFIMSEMDRRFSKPNCVIINGIQAYNPQSLTLLDKEQVLGLGDW